MKKIIVLIVLCSPGFSYSQDSIWNKGIQFENGLDWQHVLERAKEEGKDIFIDCYATWCGPCKLMDNEVYPKRNVGDYVNARFISIKLQADSSIKDDRFVQSRYNEARTILDRYGVTAFPTYLFFSSDGKIIHRFSGFLPDSLFLKVVSHALDSNYQYYKRIEKYKSGKMSYTDMPKLAYAARENGDVKFAIDVAKNYLENYLDKDKEEELCTQENLQLVRSFYSHILNSKDKVFSVLYTEGKKADDAIKSKGFSKVVVESSI
jgi:thioredoxin-related protein